jgi:hypothetical protein
MRHRKIRDAVGARWLLPVPRRAVALEHEARRFRWRTRPPGVKRILRAAAAVFLLCAASRAVRADFDAPTVSAQSAAMGGASLAGAGGDSASLFLNPAAGAGLGAPEAYFMYNQLYTGLSGAGTLGQSFAAFATPTPIGTIGVGYSDFQAASLLDQRMIGVTYARRWFDGFDAGITAKYLYQKFEIGSDPLAAIDPVFRNGASRGAFALDAGGIYALSDVLRLGLAVRNVNSPDIGLASTDRVPRQIQAGARYDFPEIALHLTADYTYSQESAGSLAQTSTPSLGLEKGFEKDIVRFRLGLTPNQFSGGIGLQLGPLGFDYTFLLNRTVLANNAGTQMVGIRYRFGDAPAPATYRERGP